MSRADGDAAGSVNATGGGAAPSRPLYPRLLRLRHVHPSAWQRAALGEGALAVAALLVLADVASAWTLLALPVSVAVVVKAHDLLEGTLTGHRHAPAQGAMDSAPVDGEPVERGADAAPR